MRLGLREANQQFSKAIKAVRAGERVILTERGRPIAIIEPVEPADAHDVALRAVIDEGLVRPAARKGPMPRPRWRPAKITGKPLSRTVIDDREEHA